MSDQNTKREKHDNALATESQVSVSSNYLPLLAIVYFLVNFNLYSNIKFNPSFTHSKLYSKVYSLKISTTPCTVFKFFGWNISRILVLNTLPTNWQSSLLNRRREQSGSHFVHFKLVWLQAMSNFFIKFWPMREDLQSWYLTQMVLFFYWAMMTANWLVVYRVQVFDWYFIQQTYWLYRGQCFPCWAKMTANLLSSVSSVKCKYGINFHANFDWWYVQSLCHFIYLWCCKLLV